MAEEVWSSWLCNLVTGLKERDTIKEITSKLAYKIQSLWTWSTRFGHGSRTKQISSRKTYSSLTWEMMLTKMSWNILMKKKRV